MGLGLRGPVVSESPPGFLVSSARQVLKQICIRMGRSEVDVFVLDAASPTVVVGSTLPDASGSQWGGCIRTVTLVKRALYAFLLIHAIPPFLERVKPEQVSVTP